MTNNQFPCFVIGLGLGAIVGLLVAPKRGDETREALRETADTVVEKGREMVASQRDHIESAVDAGVSAYRRAVGNLG
ncbi:MAG: YtxH domain-containing protein [Bryobacterales bacterium]|nr:YtxH domain-containing protein [Bryobacterales bacterium]MDE0263848.1 YtxH domain-containing protein [Bryobacterales bacterium]MDE0622656.1 YtxH domain-containing protein [Bryobacterales bacterium]